jgi:hypothetical protein
MALVGGVSIVTISGLYLAIVTLVAGGINPIIISLISVSIM